MSVSKPMLTEVPNTMSAILLLGHGGLDMLEHRTDVPTPQPKAGEVLIRVGACGLNNTDINTRTAWYSKKVKEGITDDGGKDGYEQADDGEGTWGSSALTFPRIQGADTVGVIAAVGEGVDPARVGQRVITDPWLLGLGDYMDTTNSQYFGSECNGGFADYCTIRTENALKIDSYLSDSELATFSCAYTTAENLVGRTNLQPGESVVIAGASGGVGTAAIQLCKLRGARVIGIASASKGQHLADLGLDHLIDRNEPNLAQAIEAAAGGKIDVALDVVGGGQFLAMIQALRQGGRYSTSGAISGPVVEFDLRELVYKDLQMTGATICPPGTMARIVGMIEQGLLKPQLAQTFALKDMAKAQEAFMAKRHVGNIVVVTDQ